MYRFVFWLSLVTGSLCHENHHHEHHHGEYEHCERGTPGSPGPQGIQGIQGIQGRPGAPGPPGPGASSGFNSPFTSGSERMSLSNFVNRGLVTVGMVAVEGVNLISVPPNSTNLTIDSDETFSMADNVILTNFSVFFRVITALTTAPTFSILAEIWQSNPPTDVFTPIPNTLITLPFTTAQVVGGGFNSGSIAIVPPVPIPVGTRITVLVSLTSPDSFAVDEVVQGAISGGIFFRL